MHHRSLLKTLITVHLSLITLFATAQVKVKDTDSTYYNSVVRLAKVHFFTSDSFLKVKAAPLPRNFADTLKKYDWYKLCDYSFPDKQFTRYFDDADKDHANWEFHFQRYDADGTINEMTLSRTKKGEYAFYTTTFDKNTAEKFNGIKVINKLNYWMATAYGESEYQQIISYRNGVMIIQLTQYGKPGEKPVKFRIAYMAVKKA